MKRFFYITALAIFLLIAPGAQAASVQIESQYGTTLKGRYEDLPANSILYVGSFYTGARVPGTDTVSLPKGGSGTFTFHLAETLNGGANAQAKVHAVSQSNSSLSHAVSDQFGAGGRVSRELSCSFSASSYKVKPGEKFKLNWSSKGADFVFWRGKVDARKGSATMVETTPGLYRYYVTAQGDREQEICHTYVTVTHDAKSSTPASTVSRPRGAFSASSLEPQNTPPTFSGTASGAGTVSLTLRRGKETYESGDITVTNGIWSHTVHEPLSAGKYKATLSYPDTAKGKDVKLASASLNIYTWSEEGEATRNPVFVGVYESSASDRTVTVHIESNGRSLPQPVVLLAKKPVNWVIENPGGAPITKIIVLGNKSHKVIKAPQGVKVEYFAKIPGDAYAIRESSEEYEVLTAWLKRKYKFDQGGRFEGAYTGDEFTIDMGVRG